MHNPYSSNRKNVTRIDKNGEKIAKMYLTQCNLFFPGLWQAHYQILSIIFLKKFIKPKVNTEAMLKNVKLEELNIRIATIFYAYMNLTHDLIE